MCLFYLRVFTSFISLFTALGVPQNKQNWKLEAVSGINVLFFLHLQHLKIQAN